MKKERHHIDDYFRNGLNDLEFTAPTDSWENIQKQLDKKHRGGIITIWKGLAAGLALLIGLGVYMKYASQDQKVVKPNQISNVFQNKTNAEPKTLKNTDFTAKTNTSNQNKANKPKNTTSTVLAGNSITYKKNQSIDNKNDIKTIENSNPKIEETNSGVKNNHEATETEASDKNLVISNQPTEAKLNYLNSLGIDLKNNAKPTLAVQKEKPGEINPFIDPNLALAENINIPETKKIKRWSISGQVAPLYSYRQSEQTTGESQNDEKGLMAYAGGFKVDYKTSRRFSVQTGIFYSVMGQTLNNVKGTILPKAYQGNLGSQSSSVMYSTSNSMGPIINKSNGSSNSAYFDAAFSNTGNDLNKINNTSNITSTNVSALQNTDITATIVQELKFVEVPILARFKLIDKKIGLNLLGGVSANFLVNNDVILKQSQGASAVSNWQTGDLNNINYSGTIGLGFTYAFLNKLDLSIEPTYKYYLNSISADKNLNYRPYAFGVFTGIIYKF